MSENDRRRAFDRFWQGAGTRGGHSGLGLAIVRQLALRNDVSVELRPSEPTGLAAVIRITSTRGFRAIRPVDAPSRSDRPAIVRGQCSQAECVAISTEPLRSRTATGRFLAGSGRTLAKPLPRLHSPLRVRCRYLKG